MSEENHEIIKYFQNGRHPLGLPHPTIMEGFIQFINELESGGINFRTISKIVLLGQIDEASWNLEDVSRRIINGSFSGKLSTKEFNVVKDYYNLYIVQIDHKEILFLVQRCSLVDYLKNGIVVKIELASEEVVGQIEFSDVIFVK